MTGFEDIWNMKPYALDAEEKETVLTRRLKELTLYHYNNCAEYRKVLDSMGFDPHSCGSVRDLPFLPVQLFKELELKSVPDWDIVKTITSSATTGQRPARIFLDRATAANQQRALVKTVSDFTGKDRLPMVIIDCPSVLKNRDVFSARGAGILGFSIFGTRRIYALNDNMELDTDGLARFLDVNRGSRILLFGFTFMVWQYFYKELVRLEREAGIRIDLSDGILIHGGGWKKLASLAVSRKEFHDGLQRVCGLTEIHDYYGMAEQTGCIYMECEYGYLHAGIFSDVIIRRPVDFSLCNPGEKGIIQVVSMIPESYPGHSLLTGDEGVIAGTDDCPCGRRGTRFLVAGRMKQAEMRGCSDTYAQGF